MGVLFLCEEWQKRVKEHKNKRFNISTVLTAIDDPLPMLNTLIILQKMGPWFGIPFFFSEED